VQKKPVPVPEISCAESTTRAVSGQASQLEPAIKTAKKTKNHEGHNRHKDAFEARNPRFGNGLGIGFDPDCSGPFGISGTAAAGGCTAGANRV
jgi:hypothetical protein